MVLLAELDEGNFEIGISQWPERASNCLKRLPHHQTKNLWCRMKQHQPDERAGGAVAARLAGRAEPERAEHARVVFEEAKHREHAEEQRLLKAEQLERVRAAPAAECTVTQTTLQGRRP